MNDPIPVNPLEGQVAIPWSRAGGRVIGRLGARAMRWVEESVGKPIDDIYNDLAIRSVAAQRAMKSGRAEVGRAVTFPVVVLSTLLWAAIEHERRKQGAPGPEYTIDDADEIVEEIGIDDAVAYAMALIQLSMPFKSRMQAIDDAALAAGEESPLERLRAVAAGTGIGTSPAASPPG